jgi:protein transport protein SEC31
VGWCPRNPDLLATAFFDGTIGIHSIQSTNEVIPITQDAPQPDGADIFDVPGFSRSTQGTLSLKQPPKWLRRPASVSWGFGGTLVTVSNLPSAHGKNQSSVVHLRRVVTEREFVERAKALQAAIVDGTLGVFAEERSAELEVQTKGDGTEGAAWKALLSLFKADSRDELVTLLGFSKTEIAARVAEAVANVRKGDIGSSTVRVGSDDGELSSERPHAPVVSFAEPERSDSSDGDHDAALGAGSVEKTPSEVSASATSDVTNGGTDDSPQVIPHHNYGLDSSVAATIGSGPSSVASESLKSNVFKIYPSNESEINRLVTKALVLGDFESAVELCLSSERYTDAILLAVRGGQELLQRTQKAYFDRQTGTLPYLRLFQSIVTNDLADIVQNADLKEWHEIFVVICTFAGKDEFPELVEGLGRRLEFQWSISQSSAAAAAVEDEEEGGEDEKKGAAVQWRKNATLTYLAAGRLERLVGVWMEELAEEEARLVADERQNDLSRYTAHAYALQTLIEKVTVFRSATNYVDEDLSNAAATDAVSGALPFKLSTMYDLYFEYAGLLASQGLVKEAVRFFKLAPKEYKGSEAGAYCREQLLAASEATVAKSVPSAPQPAAQASVQGSAMQSIYGGYAPKVQPAAAPSYPSYGMAGQSTAHASANPYGVVTAQPPQQQQPSYHISAPTYGNSAYNPPHSLGAPPHLHTQAPQPGMPGLNSVGPPRTSAALPVAPPPPKRRDNAGWNDAPVVPTPDRRSPSVAANAAKPAAIMSPFPNASPSPSLVAPPPPQRPPSVQAGVPPPPPPAGAARVQPAAHLAPHATAHYPERPPSGPPHAMAPSRMMSPPQGGARLPPPGQYATAPSSRGPVPGQTPPPSQFARAQPAPPSGLPHPPPPPHAGIAGPPSGHAQPPPPPPGYGRGTPPPPPHQHPHPPAAGQFVSGAMQQGAYFTPPQQPQQQSGPYGPPPQGIPRAAPQTQAPAAAPPAAAPGSGGAPPSRQAAKPGPAPPKYRQSCLLIVSPCGGMTSAFAAIGDRSHIPEYALPAFNILSEQMNRLRQTTQVWLVQSSPGWFHLQRERSSLNKND